MKTWIRPASLAMFALALAACSRGDQPAGDATQPVADAVIDTPAASEGRTLKKPLAKGVELGFSHHVRRDRVEETKPGVFRRRVLLEYLGMQQQQAAGALIADMAEAGYDVASRRTEADGRIRLTFQKGKRKITALVRHGGKLQNSAATGAILVSIPAKAPGASRDDGAVATTGQATD